MRAFCVHDHERHRRGLTETPTRYVCGTIVAVLRVSEDRNVRNTVEGEGERGLKTQEVRRACARTEFRRPAVGFRCVIFFIRTRHTLRDAVHANKQRS